MTLHHVKSNEFQIFLLGFMMCAAVLGLVNRLLAFTIVLCLFFNLFVKFAGNIKTGPLKSSFFILMIIGYYYLGYKDIIGSVPYSVLSLSFLLAIVYMNNCIRGVFSVSRRQLVVIVLLFLMFLWIMLLQDRQVITLLKLFWIPIFLILSLSEVIRTEEQSRRALSLMAVLVAISCVVALLQMLDIDFFWNLRMMIGRPSQPQILDQFVRRLRAPGLAYYSVQLGYQIVAIFPFILCLFYSSQHKPKTQRYIMAVGIIIFAGAISIQSLSAIVSLLISLAVFMVVTQKISLKNHFIFVALLIAAFAALFLNYQFIYELFLFDTSALARIPFTIIGMNIIINNPLGVGGPELDELKNFFLYDVEYMHGASNILGTSFHNSFINIGVGLGWAVLSGFIAIYVYLFRWVKTARKKCIKGSFEYYFLSSALAWLCAYLFQSSTHNAGLPTGDPYGWIMVAIILAYKPIKKKAALPG